MSQTTVISADFEDGKTPARWGVTSEGYEFQVGSERGEKSGRLKMVRSGLAPFGNFMSIVPANELRGKKVTLTARLRSDTPGTRAQMWMRVDLESGGMGGFDNMSDRPVALPTWQDAKIEMDIDAEAKHIAIGFIATPQGDISFDDVQLKVHSGTKSHIEAKKHVAYERAELSEMQVDNIMAAAKLLGYIRFFHPSDESYAVKSWVAFGSGLIAKVENIRSHSELAKALQKEIAPIAPLVHVWYGDQAGGASAYPSLAGATDVLWYEHTGVKLGPESNIYETVRKRTQGNPSKLMTVTKRLTNGVWLRLPIQVPAKGGRGGATLPKATGAHERLRSDTEDRNLDPATRTARLSEIAMIYATMQHFYPYFDTVKVNWDLATRSAMKEVSAAESLDEADDALRRYGNKLADGHVRLHSKTSSSTFSSRLVTELVEGKLVVVEKVKSGLDKVMLGDEIIKIGPMTTAEWMKKQMDYVPASYGTERETLAANLFGRGHFFNKAVPIVGKRTNGETYQFLLEPLRKPAEFDRLIKKVANGEELAPGVVYLNLVGADGSVVRDHLDKLVGAKAVVFDMRGYPMEGAKNLLHHLTDSNLQSAHWLVPRVSSPDQEGVSYEERGRWELTPRKPRIKGKIVFLTGGPGAISYSESIMGIVEAYGLGERVGARTAGTNGNVNRLSLAGHRKFTFTGMKVLKHDRSVHHGIGIQPTVPVRQSLTDLRSGRDTVLQKGIEVAQR
ncbi:MAG: hypothetical protein KF884_01275 [Fimbriimonadaceae bacterium]|nr:hypothetical protein [Fimbriimonadaceae bacterium]QYK58728.1 MAG: hypothetical protein KF884_01275 [Fimbriimonadaceae bacterium]